jgi:hypothetical protein
MSFKNTVSYKFILFLILFLIADFTIDNLNHRFLMPDFKVYYEAAVAIINGKQLYGTLFSLGSGYYKYAPFITLVFYPLSILPYYAACVVYYIFISTALALTSIFLLHIFNKYVFGYPVKSPDYILSLAILCISIHLIRELGLGNVNILLLLLLSSSLYCILTQRMIPAGILLALVFITKPFFIVVLIPLIIRRYFKTIFTTLLLLAIFLALPSLLLGIGKNIELHNQWLTTMLMHADNYPSPNTITSLLLSSFSSYTSGIFQYLVMGVFLMLYIYYVSANRIKERKTQSDSSSNLVMEWFILLAMVPSLFKTDTEHFLMTLPIIIFILSYLFNMRNIPVTIAFIIVALLYAGNSSDLLGRELSYRMYTAGVLGISNVLLIALSLYIYKNKTFNQLEERAGV